MKIEEQFKAFADMYFQKYVEKTGDDDRFHFVTERIASTLIAFCEWANVSEFEVLTATTVFITKYKTEAPNADERRNSTAP